MAQSANVTPQQKINQLKQEVINNLKLLYSSSTGNPFIFFSSKQTIAKRQELYTYNITAIEQLIVCVERFERHNNLTITEFSSDSCRFFRPTCNQAYIIAEHLLGEFAIVSGFENSQVLFLTGKKTKPIPCSTPEHSMLILKQYNMDVFSSFKITNGDCEIVITYANDSDQYPKGHNDSDFDYVCVTVFEKNYWKFRTPKESEESLVISTWNKTPTFRRTSIEGACTVYQL